MNQCNLINGTCLSQSVSVLLVHVLIMSPGKPPYFSLILRPFPPPVFDHLPGRVGQVDKKVNTHVPVIVNNKW